MLKKFKFVLILCLSFGAVSILSVNVSAEDNVSDNSKINLSDESLIQINQSRTIQKKDAGNYTFITDEGKYYYNSISTEDILRGTLVKTNGDTVNYYNIQGRYYEVENSKINKVAEVTTRDIQESTVQSRAADKWNPTRMYYKQIDLGLQNVTAGTVISIVIDAVRLDGVGLAMDAIQAIVSYHNYSVSARRYIYMQYSQVSWVGCPICVKTWNIYYYSEVSYTGKISSDLGPHINWLGHPQQNSYRAVCAEAAAKYW